MARRFPDLGLRIPLSCFFTVEAERDTNLALGRRRLKPSATFRWDVNVPYAELVLRNFRKRRPSSSDCALSRSRRRTTPARSPTRARSRCTWPVILRKPRCPRSAVSSAASTIRPRLQHGTEDRAAVSEGGQILVAALVNAMESVARSLPTPSLSSAFLIPGITSRFFMYLEGRIFASRAC